MSRIVNCAKLKKEAEGVSYKPFDNELGQRIYDQVSQEAWRMWIEHSKMIVNEYRLDLASPRAAQVLMEQAEKFFFAEETPAPPAEYKPPEA